MREFELCSHPELVPTLWGQPKPPPARMIGPCEHNYGCPVCGWGQGCAPDPCDEVERLLEKHMEKYDAVFRALA